MKPTPTLQAARNARFARLHHILVAMPVASIVAQNLGQARAAEVFLWLSFAVIALVIAGSFLLSRVSFADVKQAVKAKFGRKDKTGRDQ